MSWFGGKTATKKMYKDAEGVWSMTTKPLPPEVYTYRFVIDGIKREDPLNKDSAYVILHKESVVAVGGDDEADLYIDYQNVGKGRVDTVEYYNSKQDVTRKVLVYVPYQFDHMKSQNIPVLYLLHGISGDEASWFELGRVQQIFDNMIAHGLVSPMLVVMPDCNVLKGGTQT